MHRRAWLTGCIATGLIGSQALRAATSPNSDRFRIKAVVKTQGEVRLKSQVADGRTRSGAAAVAKTAPLQATTTLEYEENIQVEDLLSDSLSYLHILQAESEVQIDRNVTKTKLRDTCTEIVRIASPNGVTTACLDNPLFAAERGMIEIPINSMFLDLLTTNKKVKVSDKWDIEHDVACKLLGLDALLDGKLVGFLVDVDEKTVHLQIKGTVTGSVRKVATTIEVDGKAQVDRANNRVTWFVANVEETREISEHAPGFKALAQVEIRRTPIEAMGTHETLETISSRIPDKESSELQQFQSNLGFYRFLANRNWITFRDNGEEAAYRYIVDNMRVAQCNVTNMIDYEPGRQLSLEGFVADVKTSLGKSLVELVESSEQVTSSKMRALKVVSRGSIQEIDIIWIHYHISNDDGRRAVVVFMLNAEEYEAFGSEDSQIVSTFELINWPQKLDKAALEQAAKADEPGSAAPKATTSDATNRFKSAR